MHLLCIDYRNLDNPLFLKSFAEALRRLGATRTLILHGDSAYTDRIMQTGVMREHAQIRSLQDLNNRLVTFLSDAGLACVGVNGFQRGLVVRSEGDIKVNTRVLDRFPPRTHLVISSLIEDKDSASRVMLPLGEFAMAVQRAYPDATMGVFSPDEKDHFTISRPEEVPGTVFFEEYFPNAVLAHIPDEFKSYPENYDVIKPLFNSDLGYFAKLTHIRRGAP